MARNPYLDLTIIDLARAAARRAGELAEPRPRTPEERRTLAQDTGLLLIALDMAISGSASPNVPTTPAWAYDHGQSIGLAFQEWVKSQNRKTRHLALLMATEQHLGPRSRRWYMETEIDGQKAYSLAIESDEGLRRVLDHLGTLPRPH